MNCSISGYHLYILRLQNVYQCSVKETVTCFFPTCMTFLDNAIGALALISMKKNFAVLWHSSFDKCNHFPRQSALTELTRGDCGILKGPFNF